MCILGQVYTGRDQLHWPSYGHTLGSRLREIRQIRGYSQEELAEMVKLSRNAISNLERNENNNGKPGDPLLSTVYKLSRALNVPPVALLPAGGETPDYICVDDQLPVDIHWPSKQEEFLFGSPDPAPAESGNPDDLGELDELDELDEEALPRRVAGHEPPRALPETS